MGAAGVSEFADTHARLGRMHGYTVSGPFDPSPIEDAPPVVQGALLAILTRLAESQERQARQIAELTQALKAGAVGDWR